MRFFSAVFLCLLAGCAPHKTRNANLEEPETEALIRQYVAAFNAHDIAAMLALATDDISWVRVTGDRVSVATTGKEALEKAMSTYFENTPSARSEIEALMTAGVLVTVRERAHWTGKNGPKSQMALAVYQVKEGKINRVWYYPAEP